MVGTTIGPLDKSVRDDVKKFRDSEGHPNYNSAVRALLENAESDGNA